MTPTSLHTVTPSVVQSEVGLVVAKGYTDKPVVIIRGRRSAAMPEQITVDDTTVDVVVCPSALAVYDAIYQTSRANGLAIITDCTEEQLGPDVLHHIIGHKLRQPRAWDTLKTLFGASAIGSDLLSVPDADQVAEGLLAVVTPGHPAVHSGGDALTATTVFTAVAQDRLALNDPADIAAVLQWSLQNTSSAALHDIETTGGRPLLAAYVSWWKHTLGSRGQLVASMAGSSQRTSHGLTNLAPLGLASYTLLLAHNECEPGSQDAIAATVSLAKLQHLWGTDAPDLTGDSGTFTLLGKDICRFVDRLLSSPETRHQGLDLINRADSLLTEHAPAHLLAASSYSAIGWEKQIETCARYIANNAPEAEEAWRTCQRHALAAGEPQVMRPLENALRLSRWLRTSPVPQYDSLPAAVAQYLAEHGWVDAAVSVVHQGSHDERVSASYRDTLKQVQRVRRKQDRSFARHVATTGASRRELNTTTLFGVEDIIERVVTPLSGHKPVLMLVLDGMSTAAATTIAQAMQDDGWYELTEGGKAKRQAALAVLPSLTEHSRTSLFCARLVSGSSDKEKTGFTAATADIAKCTGVAFHKRDLYEDSVGRKVAPRVANAIADTEKHRVVACVLNAIDDSLDKGDPENTTWTPATVLHMTELLRDAKAAGRVIIVTSDHGHVVERDGEYTQRPDTTSARSLPHTPAPDDGEISVTGDRVLQNHDGTTGSATLAVDENIRYASRKAGYHGGACPGEVVVPIMVFAHVHSSDLDSENSWGAYDIAPPTHPAWWLVGTTPSHATTSHATTSPTRTTRKRKSDNTASQSLSEQLSHSDIPHMGSLFSQEAETPQALQPAAAPPQQAPTPSAQRLGERIVSSENFASTPAAYRNKPHAAQRVQQLVDALHATPGHRLPRAHVAQALGVGIGRLNGAISSLEPLLNLDGFPVITADDTNITLNVDLLCEQFEVSP